MHRPPFSITDHVLQLCADIQIMIGELKTYELIKPSPQLRRKNKIKTIHHSLAIEGNSLNLDHVSALLDNKRVIGPLKEIHEVKNAIQLYEQISQFDPISEKHFLRAHSILMQNLIAKPGSYRKGAIGIFKGNQVTHMAPAAKQLGTLMSNLFEFLKNDRALWLIKACVFHYELEFIHPFEDGNGRMGRFWQQVILMKHSPIFEYLSIESIIHKNQQNYYAALGKADTQGESTIFLEFMLQTIKDSLAEYKSEFRAHKITEADRLQSAKSHFGDASFSRIDYLKLIKNISTATASRDLKFGIESKMLNKHGSKNKTRYKFN